MSAASLSELLALAEAGGFCAAGLVADGWEDARAYVEAAEDMGLPIVLQAGPAARRHKPVAALGKMFRTLAEGANVPVACLIDHALTLEDCVAGIDAGFTSLMIDGSALPLEENIALTRRAVEIGSRAGVDIEGAIGLVADGRPPQATLPQDAKAFEQATGVTAIAVSAGDETLRQMRRIEIDFAALEAIEAATSAPLVLHGGSGLSTETRRRLARETRVRKINIGTELRRAFGASLRRALAEWPDAYDRIAILNATIPDVREEAKRALVSLGAR